MLVLVYRLLHTRARRNVFRPSVFFPFALFQPEGKNKRNETGVAHLFVRRGFDNPSSFSWSFPFSTLLPIGSDLLGSSILSPEPLGLNIPLLSPTPLMKITPEI